MSTSSAGTLTDLEVFKAVKSYGWLLQQPTGSMWCEIWEGYHFVDMDLTNWNLRGNHFKNCVFVGCRGGDIEHSKFEGCVIDTASMFRFENQDCAHFIGSSTESEHEVWIDHKTTRNRNIGSANRILQVFERIWA